MEGFTGGAANFLARALVPEASAGTVAVLTQTW
jgi:hypothetical protein